MLPRGIPKGTRSPLSLDSIYPSKCRAFIEEAHKGDCKVPVPKRGSGISLVRALIGFEECTLIANDAGQEPPEIWFARRM